MVKIFDGRNHAALKERELEKQVGELRKNIVPKLVSIIVGDDPASILYVNLKKKAAERMGMQIDVRSLPAQAGQRPDVGREEIINLIKLLNEDRTVNGVMVQLPLPKNYTKKDRDEIVNAIDKRKDVDGLRDDSPFLTPTVKAVLEVVKEATPYALKARPLKVVLVGGRGFEGRKIVRVLVEMGYEVSSADRGVADLKSKTLEADILISATGSPGIIKGDMVGDGAVVIDVGAPRGDVVTDEVIKKASFISPVPGGVGPVTISCLLENLVETVEERN